MKIESFNDFISKDFYIPLNKKILMVSGKDHLKFLNGISTNLNGNINAVSYTHLRAHET